MKKATFYAMARQYRDKAKELKLMRPSTWEVEDRAKTSAWLLHQVRGLKKMEDENC